MRDFYRILDADTTYQNLKQGLEAGKTPQLLTGLSAVHKAHLVYTLTRELEQPAHVVMPDEPSAVRLVEDLNQLFGEESAYLFPTRELTFHEMDGISLEYEHARLGVLGRMVAGRAPVVVSSGASAALHTLPPQEFRQHTHLLLAGETYSLSQLTQWLVDAGYQRAAQVDGVSQFALRGGILDIFSPSEDFPYRIEFWGDEIDTISPFDVETQRRQDSVEQMEITPVREALIFDRSRLARELSEIEESLKGSQGKKAKEKIQGDILRLEDGRYFTSADRYLPLLYGEVATLFDYTQDRLLFVSEPTNIEENLDNVQWQQGQDVQVLMEEGVLFPGCDVFTQGYARVESAMLSQPTTVLNTFVRALPNNLPLAGMHQMQVTQLSPWSGEMGLLLEDIDDYLQEGCGIVVLAGLKKNADVLFHDLMEKGLPVVRGGDLAQVPHGKVVVEEGGLSAGMRYAEIRLVVITHARTSATPSRRRRRYKKGKALQRVSDLREGDYVVHSAHGIGVFKGIVKRDIHGVTKDFIQINYAGTDSLFVPVTQLDMVSKYIGAAEGGRVRLNRLNSTEWQKTRSRVKGAVKEMAKELTQLYAKRQNTKGFAFQPDTRWQQDFEAHFPYEETEDQLVAADEIKGDMEKPVPMDRLLCGDVGFGKTEVALRGIFKCVMDSKQCAVLVPTTILAWQHFQTFQARLAGYPMRIELLSRFRTAKEQRQVLKDLKAGLVDVVVGTHRVVQKDVEFSDLGLVVIDEEQRFGVAHKEHFKQLRASVDVLTLSATPIPRTLNMAMSGIRDISLIEEPPQDRHPVQTYVMEHNEGVLLQAMERELRRGGQVFYLHNNTRTINRRANQIQAALPDARVTVAHGRMGEETLSDIWRSLMEGDVDILVCTTIIETGVDVPNANTLIIEQAENYGLAQLYQIRGRVGRSSRRAYAYLTFPAGKALSEIATKRLEAIREFTTFGSGFQIAMRDLEIRGAGNILGAQQHGHMDAVGYDMYLQLLEEAVQEETGQPVSRKVETAIDIRLDAYIPESYISNTAQRIETYKRISAIQSQEDSLDVMDELIDRFGDPPKAVAGLMEVALVRGSAGRAGITDIQQRQNKVLLYPEQLDMEQTAHLVDTLGRRVLVNAGERPYYAVEMAKGQGPLDTLHETLAVLGEVEE